VIALGTFDQAELFGLFQGHKDQKLKLFREPCCPASPEAGRSKFNHWGHGKKGETILTAKVLKKGY
jgi:hypothetical protein